MKNRISRADNQSSAKKNGNQSMLEDGKDGDEPITVDGVYNELIHLRKMNRVLGDRIKQLEVMNFRMTNQGFNPSVKQSEPNRPIFSGGS